MKYNLFIIAYLFLMGINLTAQETKSIEVIGSAEMFIEPDEFVFVIGIEEYWKEEFKKNQNSRIIKPK